MNTIMELNSSIQELGQILAEYHSARHFDYKAGAIDTAADAFAFYLRVIREEQGLSEQELALRAGLTQAEVFALERGLRLSSRISPTTIQALAIALNKDVEELLTVLDRNIPELTQPKITLSIYDNWKAARAYLGSTKKLLLLMGLMLITLVASLSFTNDSDNIYLFIIEHFGGGGGGLSHQISTQSTNAINIIKNHLPDNELLSEKGFELSMIVLLICLLFWIAVRRGDIPFGWAATVYRWQRCYIYATPILLTFVLVIIGLYTSNSSTSNTSRVVRFSALAKLSQEPSIALYTVQSSIPEEIGTLDRYVKYQGSDGGQPVTNLHMMDQSGYQNNWNRYLELATLGQNYRRHRFYTLLANIVPEAIVTLEDSPDYWVFMAESGQHIRVIDRGQYELDLAIGNRVVNKLYLNEVGTLKLNTSWQPTKDATTSIARGDVDNDGDLDLAIGNGFGHQKRLYLNPNGMLDTSPVWVSPESNSTLSVAWGGVDGDGDLDLAVGNQRQLTRIYFDVAVGSDNVPTRLYVNDVRMLSRKAILASNESIRTWDIARGGGGSNGDIELVVVDALSPVLTHNQLDVRIHPEFSVDLEITDALNLVWGDFNGGGELDTVVSSRSSSTLPYYSLNSGSGWYPSTDYSMVRSISSNELSLRLTGIDIITQNDDATRIVTSGVNAEFLTATTSGPDNNANQLFWVLWSSRIVGIAFLFSMMSIVVIREGQIKIALRKPRRHLIP